MSLSEEGLTEFLTLRLQPTLKAWLNEFSKKRGHNRLSYIRYILTQIKESDEANGEDRRKVLLEL